MSDVPMKDYVEARFRALEKRIDERFHGSDTWNNQRFSDHIRNVQIALDAAARADSGKASSSTLLVALLGLLLGIANLVYLITKHG
jgi:hypothetical protein